MFTLSYPQIWWRLFGPAAYESSWWTDGGVYKTHPAVWQMATAAAFVCCGALLLHPRLRRFGGLLVFGPALFGSLGAIVQMHWMFLGMADEWLGATPSCEDVVRYALLSAHLGIAGTAILVFARWVFARLTCHALDI